MESPELYFSEVGLPAEFVLTGKNLDLEMDKADAPSNAKFQIWSLSSKCKSRKNPTQQFSMVAAKKQQRMVF